MKGVDPGRQFKTSERATSIIIGGGRHRLVDGKFVYCYAGGDSHKDCASTPVGVSLNASLVWFGLVWFGLVESRAPTLHKQS